MSKITIELIDQVMERVPGATYAEVKEALLKTEGNVLEAIILLEKNNNDFEQDNMKNKKSFEDIFGKDSEQIKEEVSELIRKSNVIRIIIEKNGKIIINIPITVGFVGAVFAPILTLIGLSASVLAKYKIKIENEEEGKVIDLGELSEEKLNIIKEMISNAAKDVKDAVDKKSKSSDENRQYKESKEDHIIINLDKKDYREKKDEE